MTAKEIKEKIMPKFVTSMQIYGVIGINAYLNLGSGKHWRKWEINVKSPKPINLIRIRMGAIPSTDGLVNAMWIAQELRKYCMMYRERIKDDMKHTFVECDAYGREEVSR